MTVPYISATTPNTVTITSTMRLAVGRCVWSRGHQLDRPDRWRHCHPIELTETGTTPYSNNVWSNTKVDGTPGGIGPGRNGASVHCQNWESAFPEESGNTGFAGSGKVGKTWTHFDVKQCSLEVFRLYCFQQR